MSLLVGLELVIFAGCFARYCSDGFCDRLGCLFRGFVSSKDFGVEDESLVGISACLCSDGSKQWCGFGCGCVDVFGLPISFLHFGASLSGPDSRFRSHVMAASFTPRQGQGECIHYDSWFALASALIRFCFTSLIFEYQKQSNSSENRLIGFRFELLRFK